jgi:hypothetical protein
MRDSEGKELPSEKRDELLRTLKARFEKNMDRHRGIEWAGVEAKLSADDEKVWSLSEMERTGGEPDVVGMDVMIGEYISLIARRKVLGVGGTFAMIVRGRR